MTTELILNDRRLVYFNKYEHNRLTDVKHQLNIFFDIEVIKKYKTRSTKMEKIPIDLL